jgi:hypothetical protein
MHEEDDNAWWQTVQIVARLALALQFTCFLFYWCWQRWRRPLGSAAATEPAGRIVTVFFPGTGVPVDSAHMAQLARYVGPAGLPNGAHDPNAARLIHHPWLGEGLDGLSTCQPWEFQRDTHGWWQRYEDWVMSLAVSRVFFSLVMEVGTGIRDMTWVRTVAPSRINFAQTADVQHGLRVTRAALDAHPDARLVLFGTARGASVALQVAAALTPVEAARVALVVCESVIDDSQQLMRDKITRAGAWVAARLLGWFTAWRPERAADTRWAAMTFPHTQVPVALVTSRNDTWVRPERSRVVHDALTGAGVQHVHWCELTRSPHGGYATHNESDRTAYAAFLSDVYQQYT